MQSRLNSENPSRRPSRKLVVVKVREGDCCWLHLVVDGIVQREGANRKRDGERDRQV